MRIITRDNRDYYDSTLLAISSLDKVWSRETIIREEVLTSTLGFSLGNLPYVKGINFLFVCGKIYPYAEEFLEGTSTKSVLIWSYEDLKTFHEDQRGERRRYFSPDEQAAFSVNDLYSNLIEKIQIDSGVTHFLFSPLRSSLTHYQNSAKPIGDLTIYPDLATLGFSKILSPLNVAKEIDHYLGNVLVKDTIIEPVSDKVKILAHGHSPTLSFRRGKNV